MNIIGNDKKLLEFQMTKMKLSKAFDTWNEILTEVKVQHRKVFLRVLLSKSRN